MAIPLVDLKAQYRTIKPELDAAVARIFENTSFIGGQEVASFEARMAEYCQTQYAVGVGSGTAALQLSMLACDIGPGDEVITTAMTFIATAAAIVHVGATPVVVDIDERTCNIDPKAIEAAITPRTKAIIPVHLYGQPAEMDAINAIAREHGLRVIEDACQAVGASYKGRRAGSLGDVGCFSFYPGKNLGAAGDGGLVVTNDKALYERISLLRDHGRTSHYGHAVVGYTHRLDALQAAVLNVKLDYLEGWNAARRQWAGAYTAALAGTDCITPYEAEGCRSIYHLYTVRVPGDRDEMLAALRAGGIGAGVHYPLPVHLQEAFAYLGKGEGTCPLAEACAASTLSLPIYPELTEEQLSEVVAAVKSYLG